MTTTFHWVRHGPTHEKAFVGWRDVPADLSDTAQIARLNALLPDPAIVVASDLARARDTADLLGRSRIADSTGLREFDFGIWDGMRFDAVADRDPDLSRQYWESPGDISAPGGESWNQAASRINDAVGALRTDYAGQDIIVAAHFGTILTQLQKALGCTPAQALKFKIDNLSITTLVDYNGAWGVQRVNHVP